MFRPKYNEVVQFLEAHYDMTEKQILENKSPRAIEARRVLFHALKQLGWSAEEIYERTAASVHTIYSTYREKQEEALARTYLAYMEQTNGNA